MSPTSAEYREDIMAKLTNKIALITGGTTGIGLEAAKLFAAEGAKVTVTGTNPRTLEAARAELHGAADVMASDAGSSVDIEALAREMEARHGFVDVLFLNAGLARYGQIHAMAEADVDELFRVNFKGPWLAIKHFALRMRRGGSIVLNTSTTHLRGQAFTSAYAASKAALRSLTRTAAVELAPSGVRVNAVCPGPTATPIHAKNGLDDAILRQVSARIPLGRLGAPNEIARAALFLASDESSFMTGEEVVVDGGMTSA